MIQADIYEKIYPAIGYTRIAVMLFDSVFDLEEHMRQLEQQAMLADFSDVTEYTYTSREIKSTTSKG